MLRKIVEDQINEMTREFADEMTVHLGRMQVNLIIQWHLSMFLTLSKDIFNICLKCLKKIFKNIVMLHIDFYICFPDKTSGKELQRKARKLHWKQYIDMPEVDDQAEQKAAELDRLITMWRTSEKRQKTYEEMEQMEVCGVVVLGVA